MSVAKAQLKRKGNEVETLCSTPIGYHLTWAAQWDKEMPQDLMDKCTAIFCQLCNAEVPTTEQARLHYKGQIHQRYVRRYFVDRPDLPADQIPKLKGAIQPQVAPPPAKKVKSAADSYFRKLEPQAAETALPNASKDDSGQTKIYNSNRQFFCEVCQVDTTSQETFNAHLKGKKHLKKMNAGPFFCKICDVKANCQENLDAHLIGKNHLKKVRKGNADGWSQDVADCNQGNSIADDETPGPTTINENSVSGKFVCKICKVSAPNLNALSAHLVGKPHKKKMKLVENINADDQSQEVIECNQSDSFANNRTPSV